MHCMPPRLSVVYQFFSSFAHAYAQYTRLFRNVLMCSVVQRAASIIMSAFNLYNDYEPAR